MMWSWTTWTTRSSQPIGLEFGDTSFPSRFLFSFLFKKAKIFLILPPESPPGHREHWDCVCVWDPIPQHWQRHPAEFHQVCIFISKLMMAPRLLFDQVCWTWHPHLGVPQLVHPSGLAPYRSICWNDAKSFPLGPLFGEEIQEDLPRRRLQVQNLW